MKDEVSVAVQFILRLVESSTKESPIKKDQLEVFKGRLVDCLCEYYANHWFPDQPTRGQGFRCIRLHECDQSEIIIEKAARQSGLTYDQLRLPDDLSIWVDPKDVCCRFGEHHGSMVSLATFKADGEVIMEDVNLVEIQRKNKEYKEKIMQELGTRRNGRRGFLSSAGSTNSPNYKTRNSYQPSSMNGGGHHGGMHSPNPVAMNWYNSVNNAQQQPQQQHQTTTSPLDMFSSSPPNQYGYNLAKFSPPKYGYGTASKWNPPTGNLYGPNSSTKVDKYHWFNSSKPTIKA